MLRLLAVLLVLMLLPGLATAQTAQVVPTEGNVIQIVQTKMGSYVRTTDGTFAISERSDCPLQICLDAEEIKGLPDPAPEGALPDGSIAMSESGTIRKAWYAQPTERYAHGVLGDAIEAGSLVVELDDGNQIELVLPDNQVFEDITPRLHDLDFDGNSEVVTIRASDSGGAAVVVYGISDGKLVERAASRENGQRNRWLNIVGVLPQKENAQSSIYFIRTPHINGRLNQLTVGKDGYDDVDLALNDFSNHVIGSRELDLGLLDARGKPRMFIPSQNRQSLRQMFEPQFVVPLPGRISQALIALENSLVTATETGQLVVITNR